MTIELYVLAWGCVLGLVHILAAGQAKTRQYGREWNMGARDEELPPPRPPVGRLMRAQANYFETFPIMAAAILLVHAGGESSGWSEAGALLWLAARAAYLPLYAAGVPKVRTIVWGLGLLGLLMVLGTALF